MKILLVFPPDWPSFQPYLSLPSLASFLRKNGVDVIQRDLNVEVQDNLLSVKELQTADERIKKRFKRLKPQSREYEALMPFLISGQTITENIEEAKSVIRGEGFYDLKKYLDSYNTLRMAKLMALGAYNLPEFLIQLEGKRWSPKSTGELLGFIYDKENNTFLDLFEHSVTDSVLKERPDLVGFSIIDIPQVVPGLTLASLIKKKSPGTHIVIGGNIFTRWADVLVKTQEFFSIFDSVIIYEGEHALLELIEQLSGKRDFDRVPNLIYKDGARIKFSERTSFENLDLLPTPDFDGLPLNLYFSPHPILPVYASRGCYWGKCAFCDHGYGYQKGYRMRSPDNVCEDLKNLSSKYMTRFFSFVDELVSPGACRRISELITNEGIDIRWTADARFESGFTSTLFLKMAESGCSVLYWGLESGSNRVLSLMDKGINTDSIKKICRDSTNAGIWNHLFVFFGFPGEIGEEALQTIDFVLENQDIIQTVGAGPFSLNKHSKVTENPAKYGVRILNREELSIQYPYEVEQGITQSEAEKISEIFNKRMKEASSNLGIWGVLPREHCFLYAVHFNKEGLLSQEKLLKESIRDYD